MNLNQLRALVNIVDQGSFSAAARSIGLSQPAISLQIQSLEEYLGVELVDRTTKKVRLTEAGELFYPVAKDVLAKITAVQHQLEELGEAVRGKLAVGGSTIPGEYVLPRILGLFRQAYPEVAVTLRIADSAAIANLVIAGELQAGLIGARIGVGQLNIKAFVSDRLVLIVPANNPLAKKDKVSLSELAGEPFILREKGSGTRERLEQYLISQNRSFDDLNVVMELGSTEAVVSAVASGLGISVVSEWASERALRLGEIAIVDLPGPAIKRELYLIYGKHALTRSTEAFLSFLDGLDVATIAP